MQAALPASAWESGLPASGNGFLFIVPCPWLMVSRHAGLHTQSIQEAPPEHAWSRGPYAVRAQDGPRREEKHLLPFAIGLTSLLSRGEQPLSHMTQTGLDWPAYDLPL